MRHKVAGRKLSRTCQHRLAMRRNMAASLIEHETISTTPQKAKHVRSFVEKLISLGKKGDLAARRRAIKMLPDRDILKEENEKMVKESTVIRKLFSEIGPRYIDRPGGYTRIIHLSLNRLGENGSRVLLQLIGPDEKMEKKKKPARKAKTTKQEERAGQSQEQAPGEAESSEKDEKAEPEEQKEIGTGEQEPSDQAEQTAEQSEGKKENSSEKR